MNIDEQIRSAEQRCKEEFERVDRIARITTERVLRAFQNNRISARHFAQTEGYGYDDIGRDALDRVFAESLCAEDALVRPQIANGTHAIFLALSGTLESNDTVLSLTGAPYDTLESAIGLNGDLKNALTRFSIRFRSIPLEGDAIRYQEAEEQLKIDPTVKMVYLQRSRGYAWRNALTIDEIQKAVSFVRAIRKDVIIFVDN